MAQLLTPQESRRRKWRGKRHERELVEFLKSRNYSARRSAASGIGRSFPDVEAVWGNGSAGLYVAFEVKSGHTKYIRVKREQVLKLREATSFFKGTCMGTQEVVAVAFSHQGKSSSWIFYQVKPGDYEKKGLIFRPDTPSTWEP